MYHIRRFNVNAHLARTQLQQILRAHHFPVSRLGDEYNPVLEEFCYHRLDGENEFRYVIQFDRKLQANDIGPTSLRFRLDGHDINSDKVRYHLHVWVNNIFHADTDSGLNSIGNLFSNRKLTGQMVWDYIDETAYHNPHHA